MRAGYVNDASGSKSVEIGEELLGVLVLPVHVSEDGLALDPVHLLPSHAVKELSWRSQDIWPFR